MQSSFLTDFALPHELASSRFRCADLQRVLRQCRSACRVTTYEQEGRSALQPYGRARQRLKLRGHRPRRRGQGGIRTVRRLVLVASAAGVLLVTSLLMWYRQDEHPGGPMGQGDLAFGVSVADSMEGRPYTTGGGLRLCTKNGEPLLLERIVPAQVHGAMRVEAVRITESYANDIPNSPGTLSHHLDRVRGHVVRKRCDDAEGRQTYFGIQMSRGPGDADFVGLKIHYRDGWKKYVKTYRFSGSLCDPAGGRELESCRPQP